MPSADRAPIDRRPEPFDPNNLRRSVIAVPLREAIEQELDATKEFAELLKGHSATVLCLGDRPEEIAAARERVLKRLEKAVQELRELKELRDGIERQSIDPLLPELGNRASLASLRGRVISLLLAMAASSDPLTDGGKPAPPAIDHIWPTRFELIVDINLNFNPPEGTTRAERDELEQPDARHIARKWIAKYVEEAKKKAQIDDPDQGIDKEKTRLRAQYIFARLEGKVIQVLVAIDQRAAQRLAKEEAKAAARRVKETLRGAGKSGVPEPRRDPAITPAEAKRRAEVKLAAEEKKLTARFRTIHHIWPDFKLRSCISALRDECAHGTHVSGIIAGEQSLAKGAKASEMVCVWRELDEVDAELGEPDAEEPQATTKQTTVEAISGVAPQCKLVKDEAGSKECNYFETSGTSMAAPHVSGAISAFLSIRKEFHRRAGAREENLHLNGDRPRPRPLFPRLRARGPHARHTIRLISLNSTTQNP
jgi:hypothetical protein